MKNYSRSGTNLEEIVTKVMASYGYTSLTTATVVLTREKLLQKSFVAQHVVVAALTLISLLHLPSFTTFRIIFIFLYLH